MQSLLVLGRQPELGLAELESLYGSDKVQLAQEKIAVVDVDPCLLAFDRLGGSVKFAKVLLELDTQNWDKVVDFITKASPKQSESMPKGKMTLGISEYGFNQTPKNIIKAGLNVKRAVQSTDRPVRFVPNKASELSSAQVIHNKLTSPNGWELLLIKSKAKTIIAQSVKVQDISAYARRDQQRPNRDAAVGMLPPKLAQIIINLSVGTLPDEARQSVCEIPPEQIIPITSQGKTVLDPFCGSGVILQEALLMGYSVIGSDIDQRMADYSNANIDWLIKNTKNLEKPSFNIFKGDALNTKWSPFNFVSSEVFLGKPLSFSATKAQIDEELKICNQKIKEFLTNLHTQIDQNTRICLAVPAWRLSPNHYISLPLIDHLGDLGYNLLSLKGAGSRLIYARPNQIVARQLIILTRK
ncbi:MAG TPA: DNA methyltransferase [Candidatus Sulfotelmatobacter sp.]|nr:DNA methyltransferase [Candidatus Sulfotelmatobacter sp.]